MTSRFRGVLGAAAVLPLIVLLAGCSRDPEKIAAKHLARADAYAEKGQYAEAIIEYSNVLKAKPDAPGVRYKLARAYDSTGDFVKAYRQYAWAADLDPANVDAQLRAGTVLLGAGEYAGARARAELALKADPRNVGALILLGNAAAGLNDTVTALRQIQQAIELDPASSPAWAALGAVKFLGGREAEAGEAFETAVAVAPQSVDAHLALANYQWAKGAIADAEISLQSALSLDQKNGEAHRALAFLYLTQNRPQDAEPHFRAVATDGPGRLALADFLAAAGRTEEGLRILGEVEAEGQKAHVRTARLRRAALLFQTQRSGEAHQIVDALLKEKPRDAETRLVKARMLLAADKPAEAATEAREAAAVENGNAAAHYVLGLAALAQHDLVTAERGFTEASRLNPRAAAARLQLARVRLSRGQNEGAAVEAEAALRSSPDSVEGAVLLSRALRATGQYDRAAREVQRTLALVPDAAALHVESGWLALHRRDLPAARTAFNRVLGTDPADDGAREGLIAADLAEGSVDAARRRITGWRTGASSPPALRLLEARVEIAAGNHEKAAAGLNKLLAEDPSQLDAYQLLGSIYATQGRLDEAVAQYERLATRSPSAATGARTMVGILKDGQKDRSAAKAAYEKALTQDPRAGIAANNLAWIYADEGRLDEALRLATTAREVMEGSAEAEDTFGWISLKKGMTAEALAAFETARQRAPGKAVYHYHVGLAHAKRGEEARARAAFARALELDPQFSGAGDARQQLALLR